MVFTEGRGSVPMSTIRNNPEWLHIERLTVSHNSDDPLARSSPHLSIEYDQEAKDKGFFGSMTLSFSFAVAGDMFGDDELLLFDNSIDCTQIAKIPLVWVMGGYSRNFLLHRNRRGCVLSLVDDNVLTKIDDFSSEFYLEEEHSIEDILFLMEIV